MVAVRGGARALLLACVCTAACGGDDTPSTNVDPNKHPDASLMDSGPSHDASFVSDGGPLLSPDGRVIDGMDGQVGDADVFGEGGTQPGSDGGPIPTALCSVGQDGIVVVQETNVSPNDPIAVSVRNDGATLSWITFAAGHTRLQQMWFDPTGTIDPHSPDATASSATSNQTEPSNTTTASGFLTVWGDDLASANVPNLRAQALDATGNLVGSTPSILTSDSGADHGAAVATGKDGNTVVVWQTLAPGVPGRALLVGPDAKPIGSFHELPDYTDNAGRPAIARLGDGYVFAWVDASARRVHVQRLDKTGAPVGTSALVDAEGSAQGKLDFATTDAGGALVWDVLVAGVRPEIRLRTFDANALATGIESVLTTADTGLMPALAPLRGGYALAYRSTTVVPATDGGRPASVVSLQLTLVDRFGAIHATKTLDKLVDNDLPVALRVSPDGQNLFVAWTDSYQKTTAYQLRRTWIHCD